MIKCKKLKFYMMGMAIFMSYQMYAPNTIKSKKSHYREVRSVEHVQHFKKKYQGMSDDVLTLLFHMTPEQIRSMKAAICCCAEIA